MDSDQLDSLQRWREAREHLDNALLHFHETTNGLGTTLSDYALNPELLERATIEVDQYSRSLAMRIKHLEATRVTLNKIRNKSTSLVPINKLPREVLLCALRFSLQGQFCSSNDYPLSYRIKQMTNRTLLTLTHVCTRWRSLVLSTTSLWSKIYLKYEESGHFLKSSDRVQAYLERAHDHPLDFDFHGENVTSETDVAKINTHLQQYLKSIGVLRLVNFPCSSILLDFIASLLAPGRPGSVHTLTIWTEGKSGPFPRIHSTNTALTRQLVDSFLQPIRSVRLGRVYFDWDNSIYHNLVTLQLGGLMSEHSPTLNQILRILSACPELERLQLNYMHILADEETSLQPVTLTKLVCLDLKGIGAEAISLLLPMIVPLSQGLSMRVDLYPNASDAVRAIQLFLSHAGVTRLLISCPAGSEGISGYLSAVPDLHVLVLDLRSQPAGDDVLAAIMPSSGPTAKHVPICPKLCGISLIKGSLRYETVQKIVEAHPLLKKLQFISCSIEPFNELLCWLKPFVQDVEFRRKSGTALAYWYQETI